MVVPEGFVRLYNSGAGSGLVGIGSEITLGVDPHLHEIVDQIADSEQSADGHEEGSCQDEQKSQKLVHRRSGSLGSPWKEMKLHQQSQREQDRSKYQSYIRGSLERESGCGLGFGLGCVLRLGHGVSKNSTCSINGC